MLRAENGHEGAISKDAIKPRNFGAHNDHLRPLERWLRSRLGYAWDDIWSEACMVADARSLQGWHLRSHLQLLVETEPLQISLERFSGFYVDPATNKLNYRSRRK